MLRKLAMSRDRRLFVSEGHTAFGDEVWMEDGEGFAVGLKAAGGMTIIVSATA